MILMNVHMYVYTWHIGGSGKQSLTKLAAYAAQYRVFQISLTRNYSENDFREDLKSLYNMLGMCIYSSCVWESSCLYSYVWIYVHIHVGAEKGGSSVVFLFTDAHVKDEGFLEMINNMLTSGMVPALFR